MAMRHPFFDLPVPLVIGHRGASGELPENTLPAFERALAQGAVILETDVHPSRDGEVVICHDPDVARTTEGQGPVAGFTLAELQRLDAGYRFSPDGGRRFPARGRGIRMPTLREALEAFPGTRFNVEIKLNDPVLIDATLRVLAETGREKTTLLTAAEDDTMAALRAALRARGLAPAIGASVSDVVAFVRAAASGDEPPPPEPLALQVPAHFAGNPLVTPELVACAHRHDVQVHVWTVNDRAEMERLLDLGVDGIMSDFPAILADVVGARREGR
jgi:glycerophosphoryl diester phosphodiesterase